MWAHTCRFDAFLKFFGLPAVDDAEAAADRVNEKKVRQGWRTGMVFNGDIVQGRDRVEAARRLRWDLVETWLQIETERPS
jgi:hypothetical protein